MKGLTMCNDPEPNICIHCGTTANLEFGPDPYAMEIHGDETPVWECYYCRYESAMDV
jgi:hypothetical protein